VTVGEVIKQLELESVQVAHPDALIQGGYSSDLLSDVMANAKSDSAFITIQAHKNTIAVATLANLPLIIICNNRPIEKDMIEAAREEDIDLARTPLSQFEVSGRLYALLSAVK